MRRLQLTLLQGRFLNAPAPQLTARLPQTLSRKLSTSQVTFRYQVSPSQNPRMSETTTKTGQPFDRALLDSLMRRRLFYTPAFEIYQGIKLDDGRIETRGLYDYGPPGCALQANIIEQWRRHFILEEEMLEVDCTMLTPAEVLKTSGHVDKFADFMCKDPKTGEIFRADHLVEEALETRLKGHKEATGQAIDAAKEEEDAKKKKKKAKDSKAVKLDDAVVAEYDEILATIDNFNGEELGAIIVKHEIRNPTTGGEVNPPIAFNLMFETAIGPAGEAKGYLRPETAQGQFQNFAKLLEFNQQSMPFASACIGKSFRNEIAPRSGLLRVREFLMAEIEHFLDPKGGKKHARFSEVADVELNFLSRDVQLSGKTETQRVKIGDAVKNKLVDNETLGYFIVRIAQFMDKIGIDPSKMRFRQHMMNEMAHYAADCWDCELLTSYGWIECVGCADRSAYDLTVHSKRTGQQLIVRERLNEPVKVTKWECETNQKTFGPRFRKDAAKVKDAIAALSQEMLEKLSLDLNQNGSIDLDVPGVSDGKTKVDKDLITIEQRTKTENTREYVPNVIEPAFGIGRILYSLIEHNYWTRPKDAARGVLSFPPIVAPTKVLLVPLSSHESMTPLIKRIGATLRRMGISSRVDDSSASIGKRYARNDELGTPLGITVDFQSVKDNTFTLRDRDTTKQVRSSEEDICEAIRRLVEGSEVWEDTQKRLPAFEGQELE